MKFAAIKFAGAFLTAVLLGIAAAAAQQAATSQLQGYGVLSGTGQALSQTQGYGVLSGTGQALSQTQAYAVLGGISETSQMQAYAVLCPTPGVGACPAVLGSVLPYRRPPGSRITR